MRLKMVVAGLSRHDDDQRQRGADLQNCPFDRANLLLYMPLAGLNRPPAG
jgi:hypothetical protein